jgi:ADP-ribose pyrophosphatase
MSDLPELVSTKRVFQGRVFDVHVDELRNEDGTQHRVDVVEHGPSFTIAAAPADGKIVLVRQYRHPAGAALWELPAGRSEPGEDPRAGALRELREETGFRAGRMLALGSLYSTPGFCDEIVHFFYADRLEAGEQALDDDERIETQTFPLDDAWRLVARGEIADCKTALALLWMRSQKDRIEGGFGR